MKRQVAIVGAGPSGCYLAQALLKAESGLAVDLIDRLPVPYGLVRYGVAPDHQGTKAVTRQFARLFERQGAAFLGNVRVGEDVTLDDLCAAYDAVVLAAGLHGDRSLGIAGEDLPGVVRAGALTRALNEHPDAGPLPVLGPHPLIMGNGNVAIDILRLLAKTPEELAGSDLGAGPSRWLAESGIESITIVGRSPAATAKFDAVMIRELGKLSGVRIAVEPPGQTDDPEAAKRLAALAAIDGHGAGARRVTFRFGLTPVALEGDGRVERARFARAGGEQETLACTAIITAIGFAHAGPLPRDALLATAHEAEAGVLAPGLYATGWFRRGPRGTIPDNRADAQTLTGRILADLAAPPERSTRPGRAALRGLARAVSYDDWARIDAAEIAAAPPGRCRAKVTTRAGLLAIAQKTEEPTP